MSKNIQILLSKDVYKLGSIGDTVKVKAGYARNFLYKNKLAIPITNQNIKKIIHQKKIIENKFADKLTFIKILNAPQVVVKAGAHARGEMLYTKSKNEVIKRAANALREDIDNFIITEKESDDVWPPTIESLLARRERYPASLNSFFKTLLTVKNRSKDQTSIAIKSFSDDVIHLLSLGSILTLKHTLVGCGLHSMTGSRKLIDVLHKLNNTCSYDRVREIETAQA
jgi:large subunit ribosomal protein L9